MYSNSPFHVCITHTHTHTRGVYKFIYFSMYQSDGYTAVIPLLCNSFSLVCTDVCRCQTVSFALPLAHFTRYESRYLDNVTISRITMSHRYLDYVTFCYTSTTNVHSLPILSQHDSLRSTLPYTQALWNIYFVFLLLEFSGSVLQLSRTLTLFRCYVVPRYECRCYVGSCCDSLYVGDATLKQYRVYYVESVVWRGSFVVTPLYRPLKNKRYTFCKQNIHSYN